MDKKFLVFRLVLRCNLFDEQTLSLLCKVNKEIHRYINTVSLPQLYGNEEKYWSGLRQIFLDKKSQWEKTRRNLYHSQASQLDQELVDNYLTNFEKSRLLILNGASTSLFEDNEFSHINFTRFCEQCTQGGTNIELMQDLTIWGTAYKTNKRYVGNGGDPGLLWAIWDNDPLYHLIEWLIAGTHEPYDPWCIFFPNYPWPNRRTMQDRRLIRLIALMSMEIGTVQWGRFEHNKTKSLILSTHIDLIAKYAPIIDSLIWIRKVRYEDVLNNPQLYWSTHDLFINQIYPKNRSIIFLDFLMKIPYFLEKVKPEDIDPFLLVKQKRRKTLMLVLSKFGVEHFLTRKNQDGDTLLIHAARQRGLAHRIVDELCELGFDVNETNNDGQTALQLAQNMWNYKTQAVLEDWITKVH